MAASHGKEAESDGETARRITFGGPGAAEAESELCRRFLDRARLYGLKHLRFDVTAAEDLAQQVMVAVLEALRAGRVEDPDRIDRFMLGTCRNVAHAMRRAQRKLAATRERLGREPTKVAPPPWAALGGRRVEECLATLAPRESRLLFLLFEEGATTAEAADALSLRPGNVRVIRHRALAKLRECIEGRS